MAKWLAGLYSVIPHHDLGRIDAGQAAEFPVGDPLAEPGYRPKITVARRAAGELPRQVLTQAVGRVTNHFFSFPRGVKRRAEDDDGVLNLTRKIRHPALTVGQRQLVLAHHPIDHPR